MNMPTAAEIDRATILTWPAAVTEQRGGWFYLASSGVTGRVNAVWPLDWHGGDLGAAIDDAEAWFAARGLPSRFKLTDGAFAPDELPAALTRRGYETEMPTLVMASPTRAVTTPDVRISAEMPGAFDAVLRAVSKDNAEYDERAATARRAPQPAAFAMIERGGEAAAIGMCAAAKDLAGIFLMRTAPHAQRQGLARKVLAALMAQAANWKTRALFLQVDSDNAPAIGLYESEGFRTISAYRFWRKPR